jgi:hypothetical protein
MDYPDRRGRDGGGTVPIPRIVTFAKPPPTLASTGSRQERSKPAWTLHRMVSPLALMGGALCLRDGHRKVVGPEGLPNFKKISSLTPCGTKTPFYKNQWLSKAAVPLFPAVSAPSFPVVLRPGRRA